MRQRDRLAFGALISTIAFAVLCIGGALRWTQGLVALGITASLGIQLLARRRLDRPSPLVLALALAIFACALQLVPVPDGVRETLLGSGEHLRQDGALLAGTAPWPSLSLEPGATVRALAFYVILLGAALLALRISASERGRYALLAAIAGICGLAAAVTAVHTIFGAESLFGLYRPVHASPPVLGPLLNSNHLGSLMAVGATLSLGLAFYERQAAQLRVLWVVIVIGCSAVALATGSRGATIALALGGGLVAIVIFASRYGRTESRRRASLVSQELPIALVIVLGIGVAVFTSAGRVSDQLDRTTLQELDQPASKFAAWKASFTLIEEAPWVGIGRGATESAFPRVHPASSLVTFSHLENEYVQAVVEWGIPISIALAAALAWCVVVALRRWRDGPLTAAGLGAVAAIAFQSSVDFGIQLLGIALPVTVIAATLLYVPLRAEESEGRSRTALRPLRLAIIVALILSAGALFSSVTRTLQEDHDGAFGNTSERELRAMIERHPLDYYSFGSLGALRARQNQADAPALLGHALELHPTHPSLHRLVARMLYATGRRSQAAIEMRLAMEGSATPQKLLSEVLLMFPDQDLAATAIPIDPRRAPVYLRELKQLGRDDVGLRWLGRVVDQGRASLELIDRYYALALERGDLDTAKRAARTRLATSRTSASRLMLARVLERQGDRPGLIRELADVANWRSRLDEQAEAWMLLCDAHEKLEQWNEALHCLHRLDAAGILPGGKREPIVTRLKRIDERRAMDARRQAFESLDRTSMPRP